MGLLDTGMPSEQVAAPPHVSPSSENINAVAEAFEVAMATHKRRCGRSPVPSQCIRDAQASSAAANPHRATANSPRELTDPKSM